MKTERRHELQTNVLADWIGHKTEAIRPYLKLILGGVVAVFVVAIAATIITKQQTERASRGWADYFAASSEDNADRLRSVAEDHPGTLPALWATQREGDLELARGIRALYTNRGEATAALAAARKLYQRVEAGAVGQPVLKQASEFGLAQAFEAEADLDKAKAYYEKSIATDKDSSVGKQAQARLDRLNDAAAVEFLAWFSRQTPQPRAPAGGFPGGFPGGAEAGLDLPGDLTELPGRPDVSVPQSLVPTTDRDSALPIEPPATVTPEPPAAKPDAAAPPAEAPETPAPANATPETKQPEAAPAEPAASDTPPPENPKPAAQPPAETPQPESPAPESPAPESPAPESPAPESSAPAAPAAPPANDPPAAASADAAAPEIPANE